MSATPGVPGQVPSVTSGRRPPEPPPGPGASRRALLAGTLAGTGAAAAAAVAGCTSAPGTAAPPGGLTVDEQADIRDYGAVAGGPDCTSAINSALAAVSRAQVRHGRIRVPKGLWHVSGPLNYAPDGRERRSFTLEGDTPSGGTGDGSVIYWAPGGSG